MRSSSLLENEPEEFQKAWAFVKPVLDTCFKQGGTIERNEHMKACSAIRTYCTSRAIEGLSGQVLYENLDEYVELHVQECRKHLYPGESETLLERYQDQWRQFKNAVTEVKILFSYLDEHYIRKMRDDGNKQVLYSRTLILRHWKREILCNSVLSLQRAVLDFVRLRRDETKLVEMTESAFESLHRNGITDQLEKKRRSAARSHVTRTAIDSFMCCSSDGHPYDTRFWETDFGKKFLGTARSYYVKEVSESDEGVDPTEYPHLVLNRASVERSFLPNVDENFPPRIGRSFLLIEANRAVLEPVMRMLSEVFFPSKEDRYQAGIAKPENDVREKGFLEQASSQTFDNMVQSFTKKQEDLNKGFGRLKRTVLHSAILANNNTLVESLLRLGAKAEIVDDKGQTAGHLAALTGDLNFLNLISEQTDCFTIEDDKAETISTLMRRWLDCEDNKEWNKALRGASRFYRTAWLFKDISEGIAEDRVIDAVEPTIVHYQPGIGNVPQQNPRLSKLLGNNKCYAECMEADAQVKWIHLPANNMRWIELLMLRYSRFNTGLRRDKTLSEQLWKERLHTGTDGLAHARFMRPICEQIGDDTKSFVLMMPYIHWEYDDTFSSMTKYAKEAERGIAHATADESQKQLMDLYMAPARKDNLKSSGSTTHHQRIAHQLHVRRSLDQYYYHALQNTEARDKDQLIGRIFDRKGRPGGRRVLIVVDQLWLWCLGDNTVFTSFNGRWSKEQSEDPNRADTTDVLASMLSDSSPIHSPQELASKIAYECLTSCLDPGKNPGANRPFLESYESEIGRLADVEANLFRTFRDQITGRSKGKSKPEASRGHARFDLPLDKTSSHRTKADFDIFDVAQEVELLEHVKDIQDELHILETLIGDQQRVIKDLCSVLQKLKNAPQSEYAPKAERAVDYYKSQVDKMVGFANHTYKQLETLMDLKQKAANVSEARSARGQAEETARQGKIIMGFTVVTIIFLPLTFMTAFFALQIQEFPWVDVADGRLSLSWVSSIMFPVSFGLSTFLIVVTWNATEIWDCITGKEDDPSGQRSDRSSKKTKKRGEIMV